MTGQPDWADLLAIEVALDFRLGTPDAVGKTAVRLRALFLSAEVGALKRMPEYSVPLPGSVELHVESVGVQHNRIDGRGE